MFLLLACLHPEPVDALGAEARLDELQARMDREALLAEAERHVAWVERTELSALSLSFEVEGDAYSLTTWQAGPVGTVKARVTRDSHESSLVVTQWLERGVPCYAEFRERVADRERGARIWLSDGDEVLRVIGYSTTLGSGELPRVDPGPLPHYATQLMGHTLKELGALCASSDAACQFLAVEAEALAP